MKIVRLIAPVNPSCVEPTNGISRHGIDRAGLVFGTFAVFAYDGTFLRVKKSVPVTTEDERDRMGSQYLAWADAWTSVCKGAGSSQPSTIRALTQFPGAAHPSCSTGWFGCLASAQAERGGAEGAPQVFC